VFSWMPMVLGAALLVVAVRYVVALARRNRRRDGARPFACVVRPAGRSRWPLRTSRATWAHDVLLVSRGVMFPRITALPVRIPEETLRDSRPGELRRLGGEALVILLRLDDGELVEVAARSRDRTQLVGPFMAAAISGLPYGPRELPTSGR